MTDDAKIEEEKKADVSPLAAALEEQKRINQAEWSNDANWGGPKNLAVYFSKKDTRTWVPQSKPSVGWTLNLAHTAGIMWMVGICLASILLLLYLSGWVFSNKLAELF